MRFATIKCVGLVFVWLLSKIYQPAKRLGTKLVAKKNRKDRSKLCEEVGRALDQYHVYKGKAAGKRKFR